MKVDFSRFADPAVVARRRRRNPARDARRQAHITRMRHRCTDFVPTYIDLRDDRGNIVRSRYTGHMPICRSY